MTAPFSDSLLGKGSWQDGTGRGPGRRSQREDQCSEAVLGGTVGSDRRGTPDCIGDYIRKCRNLSINAGSVAGLSI